MDTKLLIDIYHNKPTVETLYTVLINKLECCFLCIRWHIVDNIYYTPATYENNAINWTPNYTDEPNLKYTCIKFKDSIIFHDSNIIIDTIYLFVVESFIQKLISAHFDKLHNNKQSIIVNNINRCVKTPLCEILQIANQMQNTELNQSVTTMATGIFDLVDMLKLETKRLVISMKLFNLHKLLINVITLANKMNKNAAVKIEYYLENTVPEYIYSDAQRIKQILISVLDNAIRHTKTGEIVLYITSTIVNLSDEDGKNTTDVLHYTEHQYNITFSICDTGEGLSDEQKNNLFRPIEITQQSGISLRICYLLARVLNGDLKLVYTSKSGSCFKLDVIVCNEEPPEVDSKTLRALNGKNVLVLKIDNINKLLFKVFDKYNVIYTYVSSRDEIQLLHTDKQYDLLLCDNAAIQKFDNLTEPDIKNTLLSLLGS